MTREGPDISCSMDPKSLSELVRGSKNIFDARGFNKEPVEEEGPTIAFAFASVVCIRDISKGETLTEDNIWVKRPGNGELLADSFDKVIGLLARNDIEADEQIEAKDIIGFKEK